MFYRLRSRQVGLQRTLCDKLAGLRGLMVYEGLR
ncbi:hypothetical protein NK6_295 [Bradyrhizobium diazoefficiens]|jgi:hypothetical protein|uniref:Uncharacterized protein n=1 Tax=Bradyrhizobium diazoefficiens TaxID=1355477 RepID=A0A0E4BJ94_9BRAD|nr:hypothetical protein NK6_295 [Bradyrhizobium diazoefficiens]